MSRFACFGPVATAVGMLFLTSCQVVLPGDDPAGSVSAELAVGYGPAPTVKGIGTAAIPWEKEPRGYASSDTLRLQTAPPMVPQSTYDCPSSATYAQVGDQAYCIWDGLELPTEAVHPFCGSLSGGLVGFAWESKPDSHFDCPEGFFYTGNVLGQSFCMAMATPFPSQADVQPYCRYLDHGYIGFVWSLNPSHTVDTVADPPSTGPDQTGLCPSGATLSANGVDRAWCLFQDLELPVTNDVQPFCHWLDQGWIGFSWPSDDALDYTCPTDWDRVVSDDGTNEFCMRELEVMPVSDDLEPYCHFLYQGFIGFQWPLEK